VRRRLFTFSSAVSLLLCVAVLWVRSYSQYDRISWTTEDHVTYLLLSAGGRVVAIRDTQSNWSPGLSFFSVEPKPIPWTYGNAIDAGAVDNDVVHRHWAVAPHWFVMAAAGLPLVLGFARPCWRRKSPPVDNTRRCSCGYDLRATPGRCPECGREATKGAA
jgi:hypothetical protein